MITPQMYITLLKDKQDKVHVILKFYQSRHDHMILILSQTTKQHILYENRVKLGYVKKRLAWCQDMLHDIHLFLEWESKQLGWEAFVEKYPNAPE